MTENKKRIFHWHEVNSISMASGQKATLVGNLKICNLAALISRIWSLTVHGVTQCNLLTWLHWSGAKESHFERKVPDQHLRETEDFILILCSDYNLHHFLVTTGQQGPGLTTAVGRAPPHDSGHDDSAGGIVSPDSRPLVEKAQRARG